MKGTIFKKQIGKVIVDILTFTDAERDYLRRLPTDGIKSFLDCYLRTKEVYQLKESKFNILEKYFNGILASAPSEYMNQLRIAFTSIGNNCLFYGENIITPFVTILIQQNRNVPPTMRKEYIALLASLCLQCYKSSQTTKQGEIRLQILRGWGGRSKTEIALSQRLPVQVMVECAKESFNMLSEHLISLLRIDLNLKEITIENSLKGLLEIAEIGSSIKQSISVDEYGKFIFHLIEEWEKQYQYQKSFQDTLEAIYPFPKTLCFMMGDMLSGTTQIVSNSPSSDINSEKTRLVSDITELEDLADEEDPEMPELEDVEPSDLIQTIKRILG